MDQFDIIGALETYAINQGWKFVYGVDEFYKSAQSVQQYDPGELLMVADFRATPTYRNGRITIINYTCLIMLGRKFDADGQAADLDEDSKQKYDRRLKQLMQLLAAAIAQVGCNNDLEITSGEMIVSINQYSENIDFVASPNTVFIQTSPPNPTP
jgi:hypothetical protein